MFLPTDRPRNTPFLPDLERLSLTATSFRGSWEDLLDALRILSVNKLLLLKCTMLAELMHYIRITGRQICASQVELVLPKPFLNQHTHLYIDFIATFERLEDFFLMYESYFTDKHYVEAIVHHRQSLKRLVYHRRHKAALNKLDYYCDTATSALSPGAVKSIFRDMTLQCIGICDRPSMLQSTLEETAPSVSNLRLLHLRFSGKFVTLPKFNAASTNIYYTSTTPHQDEDPERDMFAECDAQDDLRGSSLPSASDNQALLGEESEELKQFADWAFGPRGFPSLQVLASGDFSFGERWAHT